jgi:uncharacterized protein YjcR
LARAPDERIEQAKQLYLKGMKLVDIASQLNLPEGTVRRWKCTHEWDSERSDKNNERSVKRKRGAQPGNHNSAGGPVGNSKAVKHGFFQKYLPEETYSLTQEIEKKNPLDILWENIQIQYAAIIRAQKIMYVNNAKDKTKEVTGDFDNGTTYDVQQAWDKQANFLAAQSRAMKSLESMIKQYDELLHKNWELATEEQKAKLEHLKAQTDKLTGNNQEIEDMDEIEADIYGD